MNAFLKYAARRFAQFVFVIFTGISLAFIIAHLSPVDPVEQSLSLMTGFSGSDPRAIEILRQSLSDLYGVKGSVIDHYLIFWRRVLTGDFGPSLSAFPTPVITIIQRAMPWTFGLLVLSTLFAWIVGNLLGLQPAADGALLVACPCDLAAWRRHMQSVKGGAIWERPVRSLSPLALVDGVPAASKIWLLVGSDDQTTPPALTLAYAEALRHRNVAVNVTVAAGLGHTILLEPIALERLKEIAGATGP